VGTESPRMISIAFFKNKKNRFNFKNELSEAAGENPRPPRKFERQRERGTGTKTEASLTKYSDPKKDPDLVGWDELVPGPVSHPGANLGVVS
jgi:hypothetical protein